MPAIYRDGKLGFRNRPHVREGIHIKFASLDWENFFTKYGFIYPLAGLGPDLPAVYEGRALFAPVFNTQTVSSFVVVDKHGAIWQADIYPNDDQQYAIDVHSLPSGNGVSWAVSDQEWQRETMAAILMADLNDFETAKQLSEQGVDNGSGFTFLTIDYIATKLRNMFPEITEQTALPLT